MVGYHVSLGHYELQKSEGPDTCHLDSKGPLRSLFIHFFVTVTILLLSPFQQPWNQNHPSQVQPCLEIKQIFE